MIHSRIFSTCFLCLSMISCDTQQQSIPVKKAVETETSTEKSYEQITTATKTRPALKLSIDNISIEQQKTDGNFYVNDEEPAGQTSALFENQDRDKHNISFSGKLFTDENKLENKEYRDSIEGLQINIEGNFD